MTVIPEPLGLTTRIEDDAVVMTVVGEVDAATSDDLWAALNQALVGDVDRLVLDVSGVEFIDSSGLRALVQAHRTIVERQGVFVLRGPNETFRRLLDVTGLDEVFPVE
jgi:anti-sigma B factor antagonist